MVPEERKIYMLFEDFIKAFRLYELSRPPLDFKTNDVVQCVYIKGLFRVMSIEQTYLKIQAIESENETPHYVSPLFLQKVEVNQEVIRILFNERD